MKTGNLFTLFCAFLLFGTWTDGTQRRKQLIHISNPESRPRTSKPSEATRRWSEHVQAVETARLDLASLPDVSVTCSAFDLVVRVKPAFYGFGADDSELQLGRTCRNNGVLRPYGDLLFTYPLTACGSRQESTRDFLVYKWTLHYEPSTERTASGAPRLDVDIECRYRRYHHVYQLAVKPTWTTALVRTILKAHPIEFQMQLMDDSWSKPIKNKVFQLGQKVNVEVSAPHLSAGQRLYINHCYASPDSASSLYHKYTIIGNSGCMVDSKRHPGGASHFISQADRTLRFSFKAFQFISDPDGEISIYCKLFATSKEQSPAQKSCTYVEDRWKALSGDDDICKCCDTQCVSAKSKRTSMEGSVRTDLLVADQPLSAEEGLLRVRRLNPPLHDVHSDAIWWQNADVLKNEGEESVEDSGRQSVTPEEKTRREVEKLDLQLEKSEERGLRKIIVDRSGYKVEEEEFEGKRAVREDEIKGEVSDQWVRVEPILASQVPVQRDVPQLDTDGDEGNRNQPHGTKEAAIRNSNALTWYFSWT
ncbi:zona pellucida sperm-binding protein 3 [Syngnathoides biaculeatus]|uniref:zona pellucida sperm-binding protein 3 n=1 Tax=Syngnathoides biaculeatus TaxID=300417 RepID=UPI002ADE0C27|nr:zona pellucida sperm-binding protein 3 [Syngnathoides biaculeatus]